MWQARKLFFFPFIHLHRYANVCKIYIVRDKVLYFFLFLLLCWHKPFFCLVFKKKNTISVRICQEDGKLRAAFMCAINLLITDKSSLPFFLTIILIIHFSERRDKVCRESQGELCVLLKCRWQFIRRTFPAIQKLSTRHPWFWKLFLCDATLLMLSWSVTKIKHLYIFCKLLNYYGTWHISIISVTGNESQGSLVTFNLHLT